MKPSVPGPKGLALLRLIPKVARSPLRVIHGLVEQYGDVVRVGKGLFYVIWRPDDVEHVLSTNCSNYGKGKSVQTARSVFGNGLVMADGELWRQQRRLLGPAFQPSALGNVCSLTAEETIRMVEAWDRDFGNGQPFDITQEMARLLHRVMLRVLFGVIEHLDLDRLEKAQRVVEDHIDRRAWNPLQWTEAVPTPHNLRFRRAMRHIDSLVYSSIEACQVDPGNDSLLSVVLRANRESSGPSMDRKQLRDEMMTLLFTGHSTTASALSFAWFLLGTHDEVARRATTEVDKVLSGTEASQDEIDRLEETSRILDETLRLYPPAWIVARTTDAPDQIGGYAVPAGMVVLIGTYITHRSPLLWESPDRFDPDRFLPERVEGRHPYAYYPFGGGPRKCIGTQLARSQALTILSMVLRQFEVRSPPGQTISPKTATILKPGRPIFVTVKRRS